MQTKIIDRETTGGNIYSRLIKLWLVAVLLILPFQMTVSTYIATWSSKASTIMNNLDELTVVAFLLLAIIRYYKNKMLPDKIFFFYSSR